MRDTLKYKEINIHKKDEEIAVFLETRNKNHKVKLYFGDETIREYVGKKARQRRAMNGFSIGVETLSSGRFLNNINEDFDCSFTQKVLLENLKDGNAGHKKSWTQSNLYKDYKELFAQIKKLGIILMEYSDLGGNKEFWDSCRKKYTQFVRSNPGAIGDTTIEDFFYPMVQTGKISIKSGPK